MTSGKGAWRMALVALACLGVVVAASGVEGAVAVGTGLSMAKEPKAAGEEAAKKAKAALGEQAPKLVLVYNSGDVGRDPAQLLEGVTSVFDASLVYGCNGYAPLIHESCEATVAVLALGGDVQVAAAVGEVKGADGHKTCGQQIGEGLKDAAKAEAAGRVLLVFGECHVPKDNDVVQGVCSVLGEKFPIVGGAAEGGKLYVKGKLVRQANVGLLLSGNFTCGFSMKKDMSPQGLLDSARDTVKEAMGGKKDKTALVFAFDCGGRRGALLNQKSFPKELAAMKEAAGDIPIFGFYGSGEIGCPSTGAAPAGVGYHIATCAIIVE